MVNGNCTEAHDDGSIQNFLHLIFVLNEEGKKISHQIQHTIQTHVTHNNSFVYPN